MFVGHGLLAFALAAWAADRLGWPAERALVLGLVAGAFGLVPDVDILYAPLGLLGGVDGVLDAAAAFWSTGNVVHRAATHSLLVAVVAAPMAGLWARGTRRAKLLAAGLGAGLVAVTVPDGGLLASIAAVFVVAVLSVAAAGRRVGLDAAPVALAALVGLLTHPFGDLFTGEPPDFLYPLDATLVAERVTLHPDPTLHLLGAFGVELATAWLAGLVYLRLTDHRLATYVTPRAALGAGYAGVALLLPPPTLETSYHFVFTALAAGAVVALGVRPRTWCALGPRTGDHQARLGVALTGLTALSLALVAYAALYVWL